tara:strand:+ start:260 stop:508 length:249 start_codon:yes stop_codon:yes gene_type:complete
MEKNHHFKEDKMIRETRKLALREHITLVYDEDIPMHLGIQLGDYTENFTLDEAERIKSFVTTACTKIKTEQAKPITKQLEKK